MKQSYISSQAAHHSRVCGVGNLPNVEPSHILRFFERNSSTNGHNSKRIDRSNSNLMYLNDISASDDKNEAKIQPRGFKFQILEEKRVSLRKSLYIVCTRNIVLYIWVTQHTDCYYNQTRFPSAKHALYPLQSLHPIALHASHTYASITKAYLDCLTVYRSLVYLTN